MSADTVGRAFDIPAGTARELVRLARRTLEGSACGVASPVGEMGQAVPEAWDQLGAFVTLRRRDGALRGCVGSILPEEPLSATVSEMTRAAALDDPRFPPVTSDEVADLRISISLVFPLARLKDPTMLRIGEHGLYIENGLRCGVLLPQVPVEQGWDSLEFLSQTCRKANLAENAWQEPETKISCFTTHVIEEEP